MNYNLSYTALLLLILSYFTSCKKLIDIPPPINSITISKVFSTDQEATSAVTSMYYNMINTNFSFSSSLLTILAGMSSDELIPFDQTFGNLYAKIQKNEIISTNSFIRNGLWANPYSIIYTSNSVLEGLQNYSGVHDSIRKELTGEAKFLRSFCNFYLTNLFGDVPLVTTVNWHKTNLLSRTPTIQIYQAIIEDLKDAENLLVSDYSTGMGQRIIPNRWAAAALLARVYLYLGDWSNAENQASSIINNRSLYNLDSLSDVFLANSSETIWQLQQNNNISPTYNATLEGYTFIPGEGVVKPFAYLTDQFINDIETGDNRKSNWIDSITYEGTKYYFPYKYKVGSIQATPSGPYSEYYTVLRLAEQYLIRAEARAHLNHISDAIQDINAIRKRAGLPNLSNSLSQEDILTAISKERKIELFAEWGHRWLDIKRTGKATELLAPIKPNWAATDLLYPIPFGELAIDPNLTQNQGYQ